ncbi:MAG TPA: PIN domain-containing protein [Acidimicrobiales bacterium]|nr:PIN domain-containing protein [Acidimicrobiales bacterium]
MTATGPAAAGILDTSTLILLERLSDRDLPTSRSSPLLRSLSCPLARSWQPQTQNGLLARRDSSRQRPEFDPLPFDADAARAFGRVAASLCHAGRQVQARAYDAMIAATAIANRLPLYTVNPADFEGIPDLDLRGTAHPDHL